MSDKDDIRDLMDRYFPLEKQDSDNSNVGKESPPSLENLLGYYRFEEVAADSDKTAPPDETETEQTLRHQQLIADYLTAYSALLAPSDVIFPKDLASTLADAMCDVVAGYTPSLFSPAKKRPGERTPPSMLSAHRAAVKYICLCRAKLIPDKAHNKTIQRLYGVSPRLVRMWIKKYQDEMVDQIPKKGKRTPFGTYEETVKVVTQVTEGRMKACAKAYRRMRHKGE